MRWHAGKTVARFAHTGPLRILQSLYPEGEAICHNVIVPPPGGLVGGDTLDLKFSARPGAHALVTTRGATRFYRSEHELCAAARPSAAARRCPYGVATPGGDLLQRLPGRKSFKSVAGT